MSVCVRLHGESRASGSLSRVEEITQAQDDVLDRAVLSHGFADDMREYHLFNDAMSNPRTRDRAKHLRYQFHPRRACDRHDSGPH